MPERWLLYVVWVVGWSVVGAAVVWWDKRAARRRRWRVPERPMHTIELLGGFPGTLLMRRLVRHKTHDCSYRIVATVMTVLHVATVTLLAVFTDFFG